ncbi:MAG: hypothetical protein ACTMH4_12280 [Sphingobacterium sp.]
MHQLTTTYRSSVAGLLSLWMTVIIVSGVVFMHKEVTSSGEIITHVHPYDFTEKGTSHHHESDGQIQYLNVVFAGSFLPSTMFVFQAPLRTLTGYIKYAEFVQNPVTLLILHYHLRGPPLQG